MQWQFKRRQHSQLHQGKLQTQKIYRYPSVKVVQVPRPKWVQREIEFQLGQTLGCTILILHLHIGMH